MSGRQLHLSLFSMPHGHLGAAWRLPETEPRTSNTLAEFARQARLAEQACFDAIFIADRGGAGVDGAWAFGPTGGLEPFTLAGALAAVTERLGVIVTATTTHAHPFTNARQLLSLDHLLQGRAGWNIVTSYSHDTARNYGLDEHIPHDERYDRAEEAVDVVRRLWRSWDDDAVVWDTEAGVYARPDRVRPIEHHGRFFDVHGPIDYPRSPQGEPVRVQAGSSARGMRFAARHAEMIFTAQTTLELARGFATDMRRLVAEAGRAPDEVIITPGLSFVVGSTEAEARAEYDRLLDAVQPEQVLSTLREVVLVDLREFPLDGPIPTLPDPETVQGHKSRLAVYKRIAETEGLTIREFARRVAGQRGHHQVAGTPEQIADEMQLWFESGAADGFNLIPYTMPGQLERFVEHVVPVLQQRGLFRRAYEGSTLREHLGLPLRAPGVAPAVSPR